MLYQMLDIIMNSCCSGKPKKEKKLIDQLKEDVKLLTLHELQLLRTYMVSPSREKSDCCC